MISATHRAHTSDLGPHHDMTQNHRSTDTTSPEGMAVQPGNTAYAPHYERETAKQRKETRRQSREDSEDDSNDERRDSTGTTKNRKSSDGANAPVRRRISRACDQCNQLRTKCDGKTPCAHCVEFGLTCEYVRQRKKRGKASRKDLAAQQAAPTEGKNTNSRSENEESPNGRADAQHVDRPGLKRKRSGEFAPPHIPAPPRSDRMAYPHDPSSSNGGGSLPSMDHGSGGSHAPNGEGNDAHNRSVSSMDHAHGAGNPTSRLPSVGGSDRGGMPGAIADYGSIDDYHRSMIHPGATNNILHGGVSSMPTAMLPGGSMTGYGDSPFVPMPSPGSQGGISAGFRIGESPIAGNFMGQSPVAGSPGTWLSLPSPSGGMYALPSHAPPVHALRYPVLRPLLPHIASIVPVGLACDLLELYFSSTSSAFMLPQSPYVLGYVLRKRSFLRSHQPRNCSPALLASMLWVAAQTSESAFLTSPPSARGKVCQKLLELTVGLLKPLVHTDSAVANYGANTVVNGVALGGFGVALPNQAENDGASPGAAGALDDVAAYIHLATVISASEYKAASMRWWNAAWSLARELKLGRELPPNPSESDGTGQNGEDLGGAAAQMDNGTRQTYSEEEREERRRVWWLLYAVDRHLALCYNRPLFLLDVECEGLLQPEHDSMWQAGEIYPPPNHADMLLYRQRGPSVECTSHGLFGYFLPLMTILGQIVDLHHARNHPRFNLRCANGETWDAPAAEIVAQLETYGRSLAAFEVHHEAGNEATLVNPEVGGANSATSPPRMAEAALQTRVVRAYGSHLMNTLHVLVNGRWDPIALLDDTDLWISTASFAEATGHAVAAAEALDAVLEDDPDLSFMPFFFGIYLLQGSFLLLLIADKLQGEASPRVVKACETIVRAHEACVATLNTEYQRNFRKVMRSALAQVRGRMLEGSGSWEQQAKRREVLALYRWTGDGTGLAL